MLQHAIEKNDAEAMRYLLGLKDMVNQPISKSDLDKAFECSADQVLSVLLQHGAPWTHISRDEWTRLYLAYDLYTTRDLRVRALLLERGADPNTMLQHKWTPLQQAIWFDNLPLVQILLEHGADPDLKAMDDQSPMELAHEFKFFDALKLLLEYSEVKGKVRRRWKSRIYNGLAKLKRSGEPSTDAS
ncbi:ankyrin repeat-containing domain protein [Pestalotiopsis sp. NC0098]|nr:ankyrin repeat-containing domain protein [Pestalotiopsis sp. NC0098]